jgi:hypothetical protein
MRFDPDRQRKLLGHIGFPITVELKAGEGVIPNGFGFSST